MVNTTVESVTDLVEKVNMWGAGTTLTFVLHKYGVSERWWDRFPFPDRDRCLFMDSVLQSVDEWRGGKTTMSVAVLYYDVVSKEIRKLLLTYGGKRDDLRVVEVCLIPGVLTPDVSYFLALGWEGDVESGERGVDCEYREAGRLTVDIPVFDSDEAEAEFFEGRPGELATLGRLNFALRAVFA